MSHTLGSTYDKHVDSLSLNERIGMWITRRVGTMYCAYLFCLVALVALPQAINDGSLTVLVNWVSSNWIQLVLLPVIIVGQNAQSRHAEIQAQADHLTAVESERRIEQLQADLSRIEIGLLKEILDRLPEKE